MKPFHGVISVSALLMIAASSPAFAQVAQVSQVAEVDRLIRNFEAGAGPGSVGMVAAGEDSEDDGPQAIYAGDDGDIFMLDQLNGRVLRLDPRDPTKPPQALELPADMRPTDIVVTKDTIYAWDGQIRALQATGAEDAPTRGLAITRAGETPDESIVSAFSQMGSLTADDGTLEGDGTRGIAKPKQPAPGAKPAAGAGARARQTVASRGKGPVTADFTSLKGDGGVEITLRARGAAAAMAKLKLQVRSKLGAVELLEIDKQGRAYVLAENIPTDASDQASAFVARYDPKGALEGVHELPLNASVALSRRFVTVAPEGDVYFLRNSKGRTDVLGVGFRPLKNATVIDTRPPSAQIVVPGLVPGASLADYSRFKGANAAVRPLTRAQVLETANAFATIRWRVNPGAYGADPDTACTGFNRVRRPGYMSGKMNQEVQGIPYCWGCMGNLPQIASNIERGVKAGNICTRNDPRRDATGVDCSAFVSATWGLSTHFTTLAIPSISSALANPFDLLPGDALNKPGSHVMLFIGFTPDKKAMVIEASTGGCNGKVCRNVYPLGSLLARGYVPRRYRGLASDASAPSAVAVASAPQGASARVNPLKPGVVALPVNGNERAKGKGKGKEAPKPSGKAKT